VDLFSGEPSDPVVPWPTRRILSSMLDGDSRTGWEALAEAERYAQQRDRRPTSAR
jgi:hypothetical protein